MHIMWSFFAIQTLTSSDSTLSYSSRWQASTSSYSLEYEYYELVSIILVLCIICTRRVVYSVHY